MEQTGVVILRLPLRYWPFKVNVGFKFDMLAFTLIGEVLNIDFEGYSDVPAEDFINCNIYTAALSYNWRYKKRLDITQSRMQHWLKKITYMQYQKLVAAYANSQVVGGAIKKYSNLNNPDTEKKK